MDERRKTQRGRTLKCGTIAFNRAACISCRVRNLSPAGACLDVTSQIGIPDEFLLIIDHDNFKRPCHVIWRSATRIGVPFRMSKGSRRDLFRLTEATSEAKTLPQCNKALCHSRNSCGNYF